MRISDWSSDACSSDLLRRSMASCSTPTKGFLTRLLHNDAGNTLAIVAAAIFPLAGMIGGGLDMRCLYLAKTRLQQACDAGVLAGRKAMGWVRWSKPKGNGQSVWWGKGG